jgi:hypothetical protein
LAIVDALLLALPRKELVVRFVSVAMLAIVML